MTNPLKSLQSLIALKRDAIIELFTAQNIQTELEYELTLIKLDFRYDNEASWTNYEKNITVVNDLLKVIDAEIVHLLSKIESYSFQIAHL